MAEQKALTEKDVNEFLQKMGRKNEALKTSMETLSDDLFNNYLMLVKELWKELNDKNAIIESLKKPVHPPVKVEKTEKAEKTEKVEKKE